METAALANAHQLGRQAALRKSSSSSDSAREHKLAAEEYSRAAKETHDHEALRILDLLESHHRRIAKILASTSTSNNPTLNGARQSSASAIDDGNASDARASPISHYKRTRPSTSTTSSAFIPRPTRDLSASIASNLASARGIPPAKSQSSRSTPPRNAPSSTTSPATAKPTIDATQPSSVDIEAAPIESSHTEDTRDDAFHTFYNRFEGLFSKLSVPLAFAGLPLVPEDDSSRVQAPHLNETTENAVDAVPSKATSLERIFSPAALKAVNAEHGPLTNVQESFYVVPPRAPGSMSYAAITSRGVPNDARKSLDEGDEDQVFVDAEEKVPVHVANLQPASRRTSAAHRSNKTVEELELENQSLKKLTDELAHRLHKLEKSTKDQLPGILGAARDAGAEATNLTSLKQLRDELQAAQRQIESYSKENEKLRTVVTRYRERWENLRTATKAKQQSEDTRAKPAS